MSSKKIIGSVVSKFDKTIVILNQFTSKHPKYQKIVKINKKFMAHNENFEINIGDSVEITETSPISKRKTWKVSKIIPQK
ncbi:MAG: 30S ribosomal protein S17 [Candidatus Berkelbacteria bacterium]|nr:30S ribosomal protein S17 [Candidatus Berkelbacteria bacterium]